MKAARLALAAAALGAAALAPTVAAAEGPKAAAPAVAAAEGPKAVTPAVAAEGPQGLPFPEVSTPAPLEVGRPAPASGLAWSYESEGLRVVTPDGLAPDASPEIKRLRKAAPVPKGRRRRPPPNPATDTAFVHLEGSSTPALVAFAWQAEKSTYARVLSLPCRPWLGGPVRWPLRWETLRADAANAPLWQVNDGWYDERSCQISVERRTALRPAVVARQGSRPTVFAAREGDTVTVLTAPTRGLLTHDLSGSLRAVQGPFNRVSVPIGPGQAATVVASFSPAALTSWWHRAGAAPAPVGVAGPESNLLEVRVDVSQAVAEREPTVAVQRTTDDPDEAPFGGLGFDARRDSLGAFLKSHAKR